MLSDVFSVIFLVAASYIAFTYNWDKLGTETDKTTE